MRSSDRERETSSHREASSSCIAYEGVSRIGAGDEEVQDKHSRTISNLNPPRRRVPDDGIRELRAPSLLGRTSRPVSAASPNPHQSTARSGGRFGEGNDDTYIRPRENFRWRSKHESVEEVMDEVLTAEKMSMENGKPMEQRPNRQQKPVETLDGLPEEKMEMLHESGEQSTEHDAVEDLLAEKMNVLKTPCGKEQGRGATLPSTKKSKLKVFANLNAESEAVSKLGTGRGAMKGDGDEKKKKRRVLGFTEGNARASTGSAQDDPARKKDPRTSITTKKLGDEAVSGDLDEEAGVGRDESNPTGAYFVSGSGAVISRQRGVLTSQPRGHDNTLAANLGVRAEVTRLQGSDPYRNKSDGLKEYPWYCTRKFKAIAATAVFVVGAVAVAVGLTTAGGSGTTDKVRGPQETDFAVRRTGIRATLIPLSGAEALDEQGSPQRQAIDWIVFNDTLSPLGEGSSEDSTSTIVRRYSLAVVYFATGGESWFTSQNWLSGVVEECKWEHIVCEDGEIVSFDTGPTGNNVVGVVPPEVEQLSFLRELLLPFNRVSGLPTKLASLSNVTSIDLSFNALKGAIPSVIYEVRSLESLRLDQNDLNGTISKAIADLSELKTLSLASNALTGVLTVEFQSLVALKELLIFDNTLRGAVSDVFQGLTNLEALRADSNELSGTIPTEIGLFRNLTELNLGDNQISNSAIPTELGELTELLGLFLFRNNVVGTIPSELGRLRNLKFLWVENTELVGSIPPELCTVLETNPDVQLRLFPCNVECSCGVCDPDCEA